MFNTLSPKYAFKFTQTYIKFIEWIASPVFLALITVLTYYNSLTNPFQFDDKPAILKYYNLRNLNFEKLFLKSTRWISFWINSANFKHGAVEPFFYRSLNLTFHVITGLIIFYLLMLILPRAKNLFISNNSFKISFITTFLFLLHPVQTQTVSYAIQGQLEGLATLFILLTCLNFIIASTTNNLILKNTFYILTIITAFISTGTKEIAIILPILILLLDWFFIAQGKVSSLKNRLIIHALIFTIIFGVYLYLLNPDFLKDIIGLKYTLDNNSGNLLTENPGQKITPYIFLISQPKVILHYLWMFIWPFNISVDYDWKLCNSILNLDSTIPLILISAIFGYIIFRLKNKIDTIAFIGLWFFVALAPRSSFIPSTEIGVDYKTYLASFAIMLLLSILLIKALKGIKSNLHKAAVLVSLAIILSASTYKRNQVWSSGKSFWQDIIKHAPNKARSYNNYAIELTSERRYKEAIPYLKKAINLEPNSYSDPYTNLANAYAILGNFDLAIEALKKSITIDPFQPDAYNSLGVFLIEKGDLETAKKSFLAAISLSPHYGKAYFNLARTFRKLGELENALKCFKLTCTNTDLDREALPYEPLAEVAIELKKFDEAIYAFGKLYEISKTQQNLFNLGVAFYHNGNYSKAANIFEQLYRQDPNNLKIVSNMVECYIKNENTKAAKDLLEKTKRNNDYYPGLEIHEAQLYYLAGNSKIAKKILEYYLKQDINLELKTKAKDLLKSIAYA